MVVIAVQPKEQANHLDCLPDHTQCHGTVCSNDFLWLNTKVKMETSDEFIGLKRYFSYYILHQLSLSEGDLALSFALSQKIRVENQQGYGQTLK